MWLSLSFFYIQIDRGSTFFLITKLVSSHQLRNEVDEFIS